MANQLTMQLGALSVTERLTHHVKRSQEAMMRLISIYPLHSQDQSDPLQLPDQSSSARNPISLQVRMKHANRWFDQRHEEFLTLNKTAEGELEKKGQACLRGLVDCLQQKLSLATTVGLALGERNEIDVGLDNIRICYNDAPADFMWKMYFLAAEEETLLQSLESDEWAAQVNTGDSKKQQYRKQPLALLEKLKLRGKEIQEFRVSQEQVATDLQKMDERIADLERNIVSGADEATINRLVTQLRNEENYLRLAIETNEQGKHRRVQQFQSDIYEVREMVRSTWAKIGEWLLQRKKAIFTAVDPNTERATVHMLDQLCCYANNALTQAVRNSERLKQGLSLITRNNHNQDNSYIDKIENGIANLEKLLEDHLRHIFVVDKGPIAQSTSNVREENQIISVNSENMSQEFDLSCVVLGGKSLELQTNPPQVTAEVFETANFPNLQEDQYVPKPGVFKVQNGSRKKTKSSNQRRTTSNNSRCSEILSFSPTNSKLGCCFRKLRLHGVKRGRDQHDQQVSEITYVMVLYTSVTVLGKVYRLAAMSLTMVLSTHVSQHWRAEATLIWDAAFSGNNPFRTTFIQDRQVPWGRVAGVLRKLFLKETGKGLSNEQLRYLGRIALRRQNSNGQNVDDQPISKQELVKEKFNGNRIWKWIMACLHLVREHLQEEWKSGLIYGFIGRDIADEKLSNSDFGTFIVRFSESFIENSTRTDFCGSLTLAVSAKNPRSNQLEIYHIKDGLSLDELRKYSFVTILKAFDARSQEKIECEPLLHYLYQQPKTAFKNLCEKFEELHVKSKAGDNPKGKKDPYGYYTGILKIHLDL